MSIKRIFRRKFNNAVDKMKGECLDAFVILKKLTPVYAQGYFSQCFDFFDFDMDFNNKEDWGDGHSVIAVLRGKLLELPFCIYLGTVSVPDSGDGDGLNLLFEDLYDLQIKGRRVARKLKTIGFEATKNLTK